MDHGKLTDLDPTTLTDLTETDGSVLQPNLIFLLHTTGVYTLDVYQPP